MKVKLCKIADIMTGTTPSMKVDEYYDSNDIPFIKPDSFKSQFQLEASSFISNKAERKARVVYENCILVTCIGIIGKVGITSQKVAFNQQINSLNVKPYYDIEYIAYNILFNKDRLQRICNSAVVPLINKTQFSNFEISINKDIVIQRDIKNRLNLLSSIINNNKKKLLLLEDIIKSRFDEFNKNNIHVKNLKLEDICTSIVRGPFGSALKVESFVKKSDTSVKVYEQSNAIQKSAIIGSRYISREHYESLRRFKCKPGDIIMSCSGTIGELFILPSDAEEGIINQALCKFTLGKDLLPEVFLLYMDILIGNIETKGSGIKNISAIKFIKNLEIPVPPIGVQNKLLFELNQINKLKSDVQKSINETQLLMDSLMQEYFG